MANLATKVDLPLSKIRRYLEPGPVVLVSSCYQGERDIMTMGWHTMMEFSPPLVGCLISSANHSFRLIRESGECVINLPTTDLADVVVGIGNCSGADTDKFAKFGLTPMGSQKVTAPHIAECCAHFECRLFDDGLVDRYNYFIFEVIAAQVIPEPKYPQTLHYTGDGVFMVSGKTVDRSADFLPEMLGP